MLKNILLKRLLSFKKIIVTLQIYRNPLLLKSYNSQQFVWLLRGCFYFFHGFVVVIVELLLSSACVVFVLGLLY